MSWMDFSNTRLKAILENMVAEAAMSERFGLGATAAQIVDASSGDLRDVIETTLPLSRLMDSSDLVLHAEGPGVRDRNVSLASVNWITSTAESAIRKLSSSLFQISDKDARRVRRSLDLRLTGLAPGSLYVGLVIQALGEEWQGVDQGMVQVVKDAVRILPVATRYIEDDRVNPDIREVLADPAQRDTTLTALYRLSPTGKLGVHTVDLASPGVRSAALSQRERVVLKDAIDRPAMIGQRPGSFVGVLREIDLDARRFQLRNVEGIGNLRCVVGDLDATHAKRVLGEFVRVTGEYETDKSGRPRLMLVNEMEVLPSAPQSPLF